MFGLSRSSAAAASLLLNLEAVLTAILAWAAAAHPRTVCVISPDNLASLRVAAKLGYREIGRADFKDHQILVFERLA